jgi:hypothetical protein
LRLDVCDLFLAESLHTEVVHMREGQEGDIIDEITGQMKLF